LSRGLRVAGVVGSAIKNAGVYGFDSGTPTVLPSYGVVGQSNPAYGVFGYSAAPAGQLVNSPTGLPAGTIAVAGVFGTSAGNPGVYGISGTNIGVVGQSQSIGVLGGLIAGASPSALAGLFLGNVQIQGNLTVTGSFPKSAAVPHPDGSHRRLFCQEAPEPWYEDFGGGQLAQGRATVRLDPDFMPLVHGEDYARFLTPEGDCKGPTGFEVRELQAGTSSVPFRYRVVAKRRDLDHHGRLERVEVRTGPIPQPQGVPTLPQPGPLPTMPVPGSGQASDRRQ